MLDERLDRSLVSDLDRLAVVLARQKPAWEPGTRQAYHGITLGFYESELLRRIDPQHRSLGQFFQDEIAAPLGLDVYIRLPADIPNSRFATIERPTLMEMLHGFPLRLAIDAMNRSSNISKALRGSELPHDDQRMSARNLEVPSGGALGRRERWLAPTASLPLAATSWGSGRRRLPCWPHPRFHRRAGFTTNHESRWHPVFSRLHEVDCRIAIRHRERVRVSRSRRFSRLCRPSSRRRIRVCDEQNGDAVVRRPARYRAERRPLLLYFGSLRCLGKTRGVKLDVIAHFTRHA